MNKLVLHIGTHKTGSTAIQNMLAQNRLPLKRHGILYPKTYRGAFPKLNKHSSLFEAIIGGEDSFELEMRLLKDEFAASGCHTLLLSEEGLSEPKFVKLRRLRKLADHFETEVICFLRRQDLFIEALWNQHCKEGIEGRPIGEYIKGPLNSKRLQYEKILDFWADFATVKALSYHDDQYGSLIEAFAELAGIPSAVISSTEKRDNPSPSMKCAATMNLLNRHNVAYSTKKIIAAFRDDINPYALGAQLRRQMLDVLEPSNAELARRYGISFPDDLPDEPEAPISAYPVETLAATVGKLLS